MAALGSSNVYTFGPCFRGEQSTTPRHLAEFWMIEPEMAFCDLDGCRALAVRFLKFVISYLLDRCIGDLWSSLTRESTTSVLETTGTGCHA